MRLKNATVLQEDFTFSVGDLVFSDVVGREEPDGREIDCTDLYVLPGLVDVHTHGALGFEANQPQADYEAWQRFLWENGVTTFLPTTVTDTKENILAALKRFEKAVGMNMEGPYLSVEKKGAHAPEKICEIDTAFLHQIKEQVKIVTVAPEVGDNLHKIKDITQMGMRVSLGHSMADYETAQKAIAAGAGQITHIFNCCPPLDHRAPGLIGAAFESEKVFCEVISDGIHLHPSIVRMLYRQLGTERMVLISDAISATGLSDGEYTLAGLDVFVKDGVARLSSGNLAGSTITLLEGVRRAVSFGIPLEDAVKMASCTPAKALGLNNVGSLAEGMDADVLVLDRSLTVQHVFYKGRKVV